MSFYSISLKLTKLTLKKKKNSQKSHLKNSQKSHFKKKKKQKYHHYQHKKQMVKWVDKGRI